MKLKLAGATLLMLSVAGCKMRQDMRFFGKYEGGYIVTETTNRLIPQPERWSLKGYIQLLANKNQCSIHLEGEQEDIDFKGTWQFDNRRIHITISETKFDDHGGETARTPNKTFLKSKSISDAIGRDLELNITEGERIQLSGGLMHIEDTAGKLNFVKDPKGT